MQSVELEQLLDGSAQLWKGRQMSRGQRSLSSGHARLDRWLPGGGWPLGAVTELLTRRPGLGEFRLLFPVLAGLGRQGQWTVLVDPPWIPYPAALHGHGLLLERLLLVRTGNEKEALWACEQALRGGRGGAVLAWPERIGFTQLRRLQLAAAGHAKLAFLFRPGKALRQPSPAALRLRLEAVGDNGLQAEIIKCRGHRPGETIRISPGFSTYGKALAQNAAHAFPAEHEPHALLAGRSLSAPGPGSLHAEPGQPGAADRRQRTH